MSDQHVTLIEIRDHYDYALMWSRDFVFAEVRHQYSDLWTKYERRIPWAMLTSVVPGIPWETWGSLVIQGKYPIPGEPPQREIMRAWGMELSHDMIQTLLEGTEASVRPECS